MYIAGYLLFLLSLDIQPCIFQRFVNRMYCDRVMCVVSEYLLVTWILEKLTDNLHPLILGAWFKIYYINFE